jgi:hypothetical protein
LACRKWTPVTAPPASVKFQSRVDDLEEEERFGFEDRELLLTAHLPHQLIALERD